MKKIILTFVFIFCFIFPLFGQENEEKERKYSFQIQPLIYVVSFIANGTDDDSKTYNYTFGFEFQYAINNNFNLSLSPYFGVTGSHHFETDENNYSYDNDDEYIKDIAYGISAGVLYRPWGNGLKGMYVGLYPLLGMVHVQFEEINDALFTIGIMIESGYQWVFKSGFTLALGGGIRFSDFIPFPDTKGKYKVDHFLKYPVDFSARISLGYSF